MAATGLTGLGSLLSPHLRHRARAQVEGAPKRFVLFMTRYGTIDANWRMRTEGMTGDEDHAFDLTALPENRWSEILAPLYPIREHLSVLEGFSQLNVGFGREGDVSAIGHAASAVCTATGGAWRVPESQASRPSGDRSCVPLAPSVDQLIADAVHREGGLRSLELGDGGWRFRNGLAMSAEADPAAVFGRLFPATESETEDGGRDRILQLVAQDLEAMAPRLGRRDRERMEAHGRLVNDLRARLSQGSITAGCTAPTLSGDTHADFFQLITTALACDVTRVVSYKLAQLDPTEFGESAGASVHQDFAHRENGDPNSSGSIAMTRMYRQIALRFRKLVEMLAATPDSAAPGTSLLDHTAVLWLTEHQDGEHKYGKVPFVVAGHAGGALRAGRYLYYDSPHRLTRGDRTTLWYRGHNHVLVSMAQAMGLNTDTVGLAEVTDSSGRTVSLRGGLPELMS